MKTGLTKLGKDTPKEKKVQAKILNESSSKSL
jgi:hypothetical protein